VERRGLGWWKMGNWRLRRMKGNTDQGICPVCRKEDGWSHIQQCEEGTRNWREKLLEKNVHKNTPGYWNKKNSL
jgi:hypothetical protein